MQIDLTITKLLEEEKRRQREQHIFIASENFTSPDVQYFVGSEFTNKYCEGYPSKRYYNGCKFYDELENHAIDLAKKLYNCNFANLQPHSGANANLAIFKAFLNPGDTILGMDLSSGGHLSHGSKANLSGKWFDNHFYFTNDDGMLDYAEIEEKAKKVKPKMIIAGASAYPREIDFKKFREICDEVGSYLLVDMAHYSGLIAGGVYNSPVGYADFITSTTHKTLRGARGGMILWNEEKYTKEINNGVFPGTQGGPLMNQIAGKAQALSEALDPGFKQYTQTVVEMAQLMASEFKRHGIQVITGGTDSHIVLIKTNPKTGREVSDNLEKKNGIIVNKNSIPNDPLGVWETSGIRIGTSAMATKKGFDPEYFTWVAQQIINEIKDTRG